ncbi:hypothetical protein L7F22_029680 [Adiantum nelumboides]|nr:hypothetical protein [Adiantum nelumboides]
MGSLMYVMTATRPDIAFAVGVVSKYMSNPGKKHCEAVKGIMRYLKHTKSMRICYGSQDLSVRGYTDSDNAGDLDKRRSTSSYVFTLAGGAISWRCRLQDCITHSTTEAEYVAANEAYKEAIWLGRLVADLGIKVEIPELYYDSRSAIQLAKNPVFHSKTKHIDVRYHFIREVLENKQIQLMKIHTKDNLVDLLTNGLPVEDFVHYSTRSSKPKSASYIEKTESDKKESPKQPSEKVPSEFEESDEENIPTPLERKGKEKSKVYRMETQIAYAHAQARVEERRRQLAAAREAKAAVAKTPLPQTMEQARQSRIEAEKKLQLESQRIEAEQKAKEVEVSSQSTQESKEKKFVDLTSHMELRKKLQRDKNIEEQKVAALACEKIKEGLKRTAEQVVLEPREGEPK